MKHHEHAEQAALFRWAAMASARHPALHLLHAIPNGGHRDIRVARKLKAEGVKRGVPDLCLPVARGGFHGLYIELKALDGTATREQRRWVVALRLQGYRAEVCRGWCEARALIVAYLQGDADVAPQESLSLHRDARHSGAARPHVHSLPRVRRST